MNESHRPVTEELVPEASKNSLPPATGASFIASNGERSRGVAPVAPVAPLPLDALGKRLDRRGTTLCHFLRIIQAPEFDGLAHSPSLSRHLAEETATLRKRFPHSPPNFAEEFALLKVLEPFIGATGQLDSTLFCRRWPGAEPLLEAMANISLPALGPFGQGIPAVAWSDWISAALSAEQRLGQLLIDAMLPRSLEAVDFVVRQAKPQALENHMVFGVQHLLATQRPVMTAFETLGVKKEDIHLMGIPYSTSPLVASVFADHGYQVDEGRTRLAGHQMVNFDFHEERVRQIDRTLQQLIAKSEKTVRKFWYLMMVAWFLALWIRSFERTPIFSKSLSRQRGASPKSIKLSPVGRLSMWLAPR